MIQHIITLMLSRREEKGATATEYAVLVAFIALLITAGALLFSGSLNTFFETLGNTVEGWSDGGELGGGA